MQLATCKFRGETLCGVARGDQIDLLDPAAGDAITVMTTGEVGRVRQTVALTDVEYLPPIPNPAKIICVGLNYEGHLQESSLERPAYPSVFPRFIDSFVGHQRPVIAPSVSSQFDFEGELAVIIGRRTWRVSPADASAHIGGYACLAENSVRDFQGHSRQVTAGKNFFASGSFGPWLTTADEVPDPSLLELTTRLNGDVVQQAALSDLIFDIPAIISYLSQFTPLLPGDVIATGTPSGVGGARKPPLWLKPGDVLEIEIPGVGHLINPILAEGAVRHSF